MITSRQKQLIAQIAETEYGHALFAWVKEELELLEGVEETGLKICDDPLSHDFRCQLGQKIAFRRILNKPKQCLQELSQEESK